MGWHLPLQHLSPTPTHVRMLHVVTKELLHLCDIVSGVSVENKDKKEDSAYGIIIVQKETHKHRKWIYAY